MIPKNQNFKRFSRVSRFRSDKKVLSNQFIIGCTVSQSKNRCSTVSIGIGPWFFSVQNEQPGALPGTKLESLWFVPRELLKNLKLNSRRSIGRKLLLQKPSRHLFVSESTSKTPQLRSNVLTIFKSSTRIFAQRYLQRIFLIGFEPFLNRLKNSATERELPSELIGALKTALEVKKHSCNLR